MDKNNPAFTLIEMLVVTAIVVMLSGTSLALFSTYKDDKALGGQAQLLTHILELAKNKATSGDTSLCSNQSTAYVNSYSVSVNTAAHTIILTPGCSTSPTPVQYTIPSTITYTPSSFTVQFDGQNYSGDTARYIIENTTTSKCKYVDIDVTGLITNGDVTCP